MSERITALLNFDQMIDRLKFNLESARSAIEHGECQDPQDCEALRDYADKIEESIHKLEVARQISQKGRLDEEDVGKAMSITCFGDIGYCCGLTKACVWRDACRQALRIDDETYIAVKEAVIRHMLERVNRMNSQT
jgi:predicted metal-binding transcription factor (methanogenesis marker protein 9)